MISILKARANEHGERKSKNVRMKWLTPLTNEEILKIDAYNKKGPKKHVPWGNNLVWVYIEVSLMLED